MSQTTGLSVASADQVRASREELLALAERHGLSRLRLSASGRIVASVEHGRGYVDVVRFERDAAAILGASVDVVSDDVLDGAVDDELRAGVPCDHGRPRGARGAAPRRRVQHGARGRVRRGHGRRR